MQKWQSELRSMTLCDIYVEFKQELKIEKSAALKSKVQFQTEQQQNL